MFWGSLRNPPSTGSSFTAKLLIYLHLYLSGAEVNLDFVDQVPLRNGSKVFTPKQDGMERLGAEAKQEIIGMTQAITGWVS